MCGIYGSTITYSDRLFREKLDIFKFRGPDYTGLKYYPLSDGQLTFGHNRLAIIDLDKRSNQPFDYSEDLSVVFNGEIYNFPELKQVYCKDRVFRTTSDTEVLGALYERFGEACTQYLNGMFAFVIYDKRKQILFGARDRLGKKPFFYHYSSRGFEFASQLFPLCLGNNYTIDEEVRKYYFLLQYIPDPYSIFKEVHKLRAGEQFTYNLVTKRLEITPYWDIHSNSCGFTAPRSYEEALETVDGLLADAVSKRLVADVPVGVFLSGGIDSSLVTTYVSRINPRVEAFSVGFNEARYDESEYAKAVAERLQIKYHPILCDTRVVLGMIDSLFRYYDEPFGDSSALPTSLLAQEVRKYVTVALGGDGGDEIFWGYGRYLATIKYRNLLKLPLAVRKIFSYLLPSGKYRKYGEALLQKNIGDLYAYKLYYANQAVYNYDAKACFYSLADVHYLQENESREKALSDFDLKTYLNYDINTKVDRATMRSALELRSPVMDYRLVEYSRLLPLEYMYTPETGQKRILRDLLYRDLPPEIFERKKQGFAMPVDLWFRGELRDLLVEVVNEKALADIPELNSGAVIARRDKHIQGEENNSTMLWYIFSYLLWYRIYKSLIYK